MKEYKVLVDDEGTIRWYKNGKLHRKDGPAVEYADGRQYWYINGELITEEEFNKQHKKRFSDQP